MAGDEVMVIMILTELILSSLLVVLPLLLFPFPLLLIFLCLFIALIVIAIAPLFTAIAVVLFLLEIGLIVAGDPLGFLAPKLSHGCGGGDRWLDRDDPSRLSHESCDPVLRQGESVVQNGESPRDDIQLQKRGGREEKEERSVERLLKKVKPVR
jgi:hypothetical protein